MVAGRTVTFGVRAQEAGQRLDRVVAERAGGIGRRRARELIELGSVTVDGSRARAADLLRAGATVSVELSDERALPDPRVLLDVRLETESVVILNKPAGVPTVPLRAGELGTIANGLVARYPELAGIGHRPREPGLIHRLDTPTSGLVVAARSENAFAGLKRALEEGRLVKRYLAIVGGAELPEHGVVESPLTPDSRARGRVKVAEPGERYARPSLTRFRVLASSPRYRLLELEVSRGFRHQIRAHLASLGAPLHGDAKYGGSPWPERPGRFALHASYVAWAGDGTLAGFEMDLELPDDMRGLLPG